MYVHTYTVTKDEALQQIQKFISAHSQAFFYEESLAAYRLAPVDQLQINDVKYIRLFTAAADLQIRALTTGYQIVHFTTAEVANSIALTFTEKRTVLLDENYLPTYEALHIETYTHDTLGYFECWKGVE